MSRTAVVITCYELGATLPDSVASATAQTTSPAEILVVDDGSEDALTRQVLDRLDRHDPRVKVIRSPHEGVAHARNTGVAHSSSPYVVFLDGDDMLAPGYLEQVESVLDEQPEISFVCCELQAFGRASYRWRPPPYSIAEAVGRGACGHITTTFRRELWDAVGGFDEQLTAYEDVDFWLRALESGYRGHILDDALLRYRVRQGSRYHATVVREEYLSAKQAILGKHRDAVTSNGEDVFVTLLDFQRELVGHSEALRAEERHLERTWKDVEREIRGLTDALADRGVLALDWGVLADELPSGGTGGRKIDRYYVREAVNDALGDAEPMATIRPGEPWPDERVRGYDSILVRGALEYAENPRAALESCLRTLRPGGTLVVTAAPIPPREGLRGFTEASLRSLLCEIAAPADVVVRSYGNLLTSIGALAGLPLSEVDARELQTQDPAYPTIVAGFTTVPRRAWRPRSRGRDPAPMPSMRSTKPRGAVLAYHRVAALDHDIHGLCVPPEVFEEQMRLLADQFEPTELRNLAEAATSGEVPPGTIAVTFDDGYVDNLEVASPVLRELGVPATFFVSRPHEEPREAWWDTVARVLLGDDPIPEDLALNVSDSELRVPTRTADERRAAVHALHAWLIDADGDAMEAAASEIAGWSGRALPPRDSHRLMTAAEVVELARHPGHSIGSHGLNHLRLPAHPSPVRERELAGSKKALEELLAASVDCVAYPYGACDRDTADLAEAAGYAVGCTVEPDTVGPYGDPLRLPRVEVGATSADQLAFELERLSADPA